MCNNCIKIEKLLFILLSFFPLSILFGNFLINISIIFISFLFILKLISKDYSFFYYKENSLTFFLLLFFFLSLIINLIFSNNFNLSYQRVLKFFFVIFFILAFIDFANQNIKKLEKIFKFWIFIFLIVIADLIFEFFFGHNVFGFSSIMPGRLASFTGEESVIGHFFFGFCLIFLSFIYNKSQNIFLNLSLAIFFILISFLIGERANFIKTFIAIILFIIFAYKINFKIKIVTIIFSFLLVCVVFLNLNSDYKMRYHQQIKLLFAQNGLSSFLENSQYGAHRNVAKEIFKDNPIFGVGIKNFRVESRNTKYEDLDHKKNQLRASNHPHELYYEFLSETGIFGLTCFLIFILSSIFLSIKNYLKTKNIYQLSAMIIVILSIAPILPTGSFLATYNSSIFWTNYAIMMWCFYSGEKIKS